MIAIRFDTPNTANADVVLLLDEFYGAGTYTSKYSGINWIIGLSDGADTKVNELLACKFVNVIVLE